MDRESQDRLSSYSSGASQQDVEKIGSQLGGMNRGPIAKLWADVQSLWAMVCDPSAAWTSKGIAIGALLYLVSPLDAIPDLIPVLGLTDDAGVIMAAVTSLCHELAKYQRKGIK